ncbi:MAG: DUF5615 family PIN-like protein [Limisphaerales bacterium]
MTLLLDCHIPKATLKALRLKAPFLQVEHLADWRAGAFLRASDEDILTACHEEGRTFVTFDLRTIPDLLREWAAEDRPHSGLIFVDDKTFRPNSPAFASALAALASEYRSTGMSNVVRFLRASKK